MEWRKGAGAMALPRNGRLLDNARSLRREMTKEERHLWYDFLRAHPAKFYRQKIVGNYILDFYCHTAKLAIELDGSQHYEQAGQAADQARTAELEKLGITVLRFSNPDVMQNFEGVCQCIEQHLTKKIGSP